MLWHGRELSLSCGCAVVGGHGGVETAAALLSCAKLGSLWPSLSGSSVMENLLRGLLELLSFGCFS